MRKILPLLLLCSIASAKPKLAVLGNSIEKGVFASSPGIKTYDITNMGNDSAPSLLERIIFFLVSKPDWNWATGTKIRSVAQRLQDETRTYWDVKNFAIPGHKAQDVYEYQLDKMLKWAGGAPDIVILAIGANDGAADHPSEMTHVIDFEYYINRITDRTGENTYLVGLPDFTTLQDTVANKRNFLGLKCKKVWSILKSGMTYVTPEWRNEVRTQINKYNKVMEDIATKKGIHMLKDTESIMFTASDVSNKDCWHPSRYGQMKFAEVVWHDIKSQ